MIRPAQGGGSVDNMRLMRRLYRTYVLLSIHIFDIIGIELCHTALLPFAHLDSHCPVLGYVTNV